MVEVQSTRWRKRWLVGSVCALTLWLVAVGPAFAAPLLTSGDGGYGHWPVPPHLALQFTNTTPGQGTTVVATLFADRTVTVTAAQFDDRPIAFFGAGNYYRALIGIAPSDTTGQHLVTVQVDDPAGQSSTITATLTVQETAFPREEITLPPDQSDLLDPSVGQREEQVVAPLYALFTPQRLWQAPFIMPVQGPITTEFGEMRAYNGGPFDSWHGGLDIGAPEGTPIHAPAAGRVVYAGHLDIRGNFVAIDHGLGVLTCYFHQSQILVSVGQTVNTGDVIGLVGTTGLSTGPHLHWEVRIAGTPVSPWQWMQGPVLP